MASNFKTPRRRWSDAFKKRVAAEAFQPGTSTAQIAGRYDLTANLVLNWKKKFGPGAALVPVEVTMDDDRLGMSAQRSFGCIEIDLPCGTKLRCRPDTSTELVAGIIAALRSKQ